MILGKCWTTFVFMSHAYADRLHNSAKFATDLKHGAAAMVDLRRIFTVYKFYVQYVHIYF